MGSRGHAFSHGTRGHWSGAAGLVNTFFVSCHQLHPSLHLSPSFQMPLKCEPLCCFGPRYLCAHKLLQQHCLSCSRLYFTSFAHPPPKPDILNRLAAEPGNGPRVRTCPKGGPSISSDDNTTYYYFTIDDQLLYLSFFQDWGPLNIAMVYKACIYIHELLEVRALSQRRYLVSLTCISRIKIWLSIGSFSIRQMIHVRRPTPLYSWHYTL